MYFSILQIYEKNMGSILDRFSWVRNIGRQYLFSTKFWPGIFQTFIFLHTKFGMLIVSESTTILVWKCVTTLRTPDISTFMNAISMANFILFLLTTHIEHCYKLSEDFHWSFVKIVWISTFQTDLFLNIITMDNPSWLLHLENL